MKREDIPKKEKKKKEEKKITIGCHETLNPFGPDQQGHFFFHQGKNSLFWTPRSISREALVGFQKYKQMKYCSRPCVARKKYSRLGSSFLMSVATFKVFSASKNMAGPRKPRAVRKKKKVSGGRPPLETGGGNSMKAKT